MEGSSGIRSGDKPFEPEVLERHGSGRRPSWLTGTNPLPASILSVFHPCSIRGRISACAAIVPDLSLITTNRAPFGVVVVRYPVQILGGV